MNGQSSRTNSESTSSPDEGNELTDPESIIYESRTSNHITIITPIAPKVLLAITGSLSSTEANPPTEGDEDSEDASAETPSIATTSPPTSPPPEHSGRNGFLEPPKSLLEELGSISEQLSSVLREEMGGMRWPDGA